MKRCPHCNNPLEYGVLLDTMTGQRGYYCDECELSFSAFDLK